MAQFDHYIRPACINTTVRSQMESPCVFQRVGEPAFFGNSSIAERISAICRLFCFGKHLIKIAQLFMTHHRDFVPVAPFSGNYVPLSTPILKD